MRGLKKDNIKRGHQTDRQTPTHCNSMKESAKGRFFEEEKNYFLKAISNVLALYSTRQRNLISASPQILCGQYQVGQSQHISGYFQASEILVMLTQCNRSEKHQSIYIKSYLYLDKTRNIRSNIALRLRKFLRAKPIVSIFDYIY